MVTLVQKEQLGRQVLLVNLDLQGQRGQKDFPDCEARKVCKVPKENQDIRDFLAPLVLMERL